MNGNKKKRRNLLTKEMVQRFIMVVILGSPLNSSSWKKFQGEHPCHVHFFFFCLRMQILRLKICVSYCATLNLALVYLRLRHAHWLIWKETRSRILENCGLSFLKSKSLGIGVCIQLTNPGLGRIVEQVHVYKYY